MEYSIQAFLARGVQKASDDLVAALLRIPEDKRGWSPMGDARSAMDLVAECALLNGNTAKILGAKAWTHDFDFTEYYKTKAELAQRWDELKSLLDQNTADAIAAIQAIPNEDLALEIAMPWGPMALAQIASYPFWNMSYHEGQINYIASMIGCLP